MIGHFSRLAHKSISTRLACKPLEAGQNEHASSSTSGADASCDGSPSISGDVFGTFLEEKSRGGERSSLKQLKFFQKGSRNLALTGPRTSGT